MVDPDAARRPQAEPHGADPGVVAGLAEPPGVERREAPVLPLGVEVVGRRADPHAERHRVLPQPGVGAAGVDADGEVLHQVDLGAGPGELALGEPLQPGVVADPVGVLGGEAVDRRSVGPAVLLRPLCPRPGEPLRHGAVGGEVSERLAVLGAEGIEGGVAAGGGEARPQVLQRRLLQLPHRLPVDAAVAIERLCPRRRGPRGRSRRRPRPPGRPARPRSGGRAGSGSSGWTGSRGSAGGSRARWRAGG